MDLLTLNHISPLSHALIIILEREGIDGIAGALSLVKNPPDVSSPSAKLTSPDLYSAVNPTIS